MDTGTEQLSQLWVLFELEVAELSLCMLHLTEADVCLPLSGVSLLSDWPLLQLELLRSLLHRGLTGVEADLEADLEGDWEYQAGSSSRHRELLTLSAVIKCETSLETVTD